MTILDNYMFRPLLAILRLSLRELKVLLYNVRARDGEISILATRPHRVTELCLTTYPFQKVTSFYLSILKLSGLDFWPVKRQKSLKFCV